MEVISRGSPSAGAQQAVNAAAQPRLAQAPIQISSDTVSSLAAGRKGELSDFDKAVLKSFDEVDGPAEQARLKAAKDKGSDVLDEADVKGHVDGSPLLKDAARGSNAEIHKTAVISREHRDAFLSSLVTGGRYREAFVLFGGTLLVRMRSRTIEETEAIDAYVRRKAVSGTVMTGAEYSALTRRCLLLAQVEEIGGVKYPEMRAPLFFTDNGESLVPPAWEEDLKVWSGKSDAILSTLVDCLMQFETRYWVMTRKAADANFWKTGEYTEE